MTNRMTPADHGARAAMNDANQISVSEVIGKANDLCPDLDSPLPFYEAALALGANKAEAERLDALSTTAVMRARGAI